MLDPVGKEEGHQTNPVCFDIFVTNDVWFKLINLS